MLFDKKIEPSCSYCEFGVLIGDNEIICEKKGIMTASDSCRKFSYDPLRREPPKPVTLDTGRVSEEDFIL